MIKKAVSTILMLSLLITVLPLNFVYAEETTVSIEIEAENSVLSGENLKIVDDSKASGKKAVSGTKSVGNSSDIIQPSAVFEFTVETEDTFTFWARGLAENYSSDTAWFSIDDHAYQYTEFRVDSEYKWHAVTTLKLSAGNHSFNFAVREMNFRFDKILITSDNSYLPDGNPYSTPDFKPTGRPRVMINSEKLAEVKANLSHPESKLAYEKILENIKLSTGGVFQGNFNNDTAFSYVEGNAFMYLLTNEEAYGRKAINGLFDHYDSINHNEFAYPYRSAGDQIHISAEVYDWCYPLLSAEEKRKIFNQVTVDCQIMEIGWPPVKQNGTASSHESEYQVMRDMLSFAIAACDEYPSFYNVVMGKILDEYIPVRNWYYENTSFHNQGDSYGMYRYAAEVYMKYLLDAIGQGNRISEKQHDMAYHFIMRRRPDGAHLQDGDMYNTPLTKYINAEAVALLAGNLYEDPYLRNEIQRSGLKLRNNSDGLSAVTYLLVNKPDVGIKNFKELPLTHYFGDMQGVMTARTSWNEGIDSNTMLVSMKISEHITRSHQHLDSGNFEIYYKGPLAIDSGIYNGLPFEDENGNTVTNVESGSSHDVNYHHRTIAHNAMLIYDPDEVPVMGTANDGGQRAVNFPDNTRTFEEFSKDEEFVYGDVLGYDYGDDLYSPSYSYLEGDLTKAYTDKVTDYSRAFMFFNFFDEVYPGALVVFDRVESKDASFKKTWLLHSQEEPEISGNKTTIRRTELGYNGRLINETLLPEADDLSIKKVGGKGNEYTVNGVNYKAVTDNDFENGEWRIEVSPNVDAKKNYFLNVLQVADNALNPVPLESEYLETESHIGVQIKDRVVYFNKVKERTSESITVKGNSYQKDLVYTVTGLNKGEWQISGIGIKAATDEGGVISFTAPAGEYTLTKVSDNAAVKDFSILSNIKEYENELPTLKRNGYYFDFDENAYFKNGEIYVPAKDAAEFLRKNSLVSEKENSIEITYGNNVIEFTNDSYKVLKNGNEYTVSRKPELRDGTIMVPLYLLKEFLNIKAESDEISKITEFSEGKPLSSPYVTAIDNVYISNSGYELGLFGNVENYSELNVYEYGMLYSPLPNGSLGGENTIKFKGNTADDIKRTGNFGIHLKDYFHKLDYTMYVTPYIIYENNGELKTLYADSEKFINRYDRFELVAENTETLLLENGILADVNSRPGQYQQQYVPTGPYMQVNLYNSAKMTDSYNGTLKRSMIKIDISDFPDDLREYSDISLTVTGQCMYVAGHITAYCPQEIIVNAYDFSELDWSESSVEDAWKNSGNSSTYGIEPSLGTVVAKTPFASFTVEKTTSTAGPYVEKTISIKEIIARAKKNGIKDAITIVLCADNTGRDSEFLTKLYKDNTSNRDELIFRIATKESTNSSIRPKVTYDKRVAPENQLKSISIDGTILESFNEDTLNYTVNYNSDSFPKVTAEAKDSQATVEIAQADSVNKTAVITVTDKNNTLKRKYKIKFVKELSSTQVTVKDAISADTSSNTEYYNDDYTSTGKFMDTNISNGRKLSDESNNFLRRALIRIDLNKLAGIDLTKDVFLKVNGKCTVGTVTENTPEKMIINVYGDYDIEWNEELYSVKQKSVGPSISEILSMKKVSSFEVLRTATSDAAYQINISEFVRRAKALEKNEITLVLFADNNERVDYPLTSTTEDELIFVMGTKDNKTSYKQPSIIYYKYN